MFRYQIRMPNSMVLADLVKQVALKSWDAMNHRLKPETLEAGSYSTFRKEIYDTFSFCLKSFDLCGSSGICEDEVRPLTSAFVTLAEGKICHLVLPERLDIFLEHLARRLFDKMKLTTMEPEMGEALNALRAAFHSVLDEYLCVNPWCGKAQLCQYSRPIDPWTT